MERKNLWLALSFANVIYLRAWSDLFPLAPSELFFRKTLPGYASYLGVVADVFALASLTFLILSFAPKWPGWLQRALLAVAVVLVALSLRSFVADTTGLLRANLFRVAPPKILFALAALAVLLACWVAWRYFDWVIRFARLAVLSAAPCLAVTFVWPLLYLHRQIPLPPDPPLAARLQASPPIRVVWVIFDEWDERLTFSHRAANIRLPILDELAKRSFRASRALAVQSELPVSQMFTVDALAALLYGKRVGHTDIKSAAVRQIDFADGTSTIFGKGKNIFADMRSEGWNSALAGWHLPYCRVFNSELTDCFWDQKYEQRSSAAASPLQAAIDETRMLFETTMFSAFGTSLVATRHAEEFAALLSATRRYVADPAIAFTFVHFNIPHTPYFYNSTTGHLGRSGYSPALYDDTLQLVDSAIGEICRSLARSGLASKTAIVLSADHPARFPTRIDHGQDPHVPFLVYLPGESVGLLSDYEFSTLQSKDLVMAIARGEVKSPAEVASFFGPSTSTR